MRPLRSPVPGQPAHGPLILKAMMSVRRKLRRRTHQALYIGAVTFAGALFLHFFSPAMMVLGALGVLLLMRAVARRSPWVRRPGRALDHLDDLLALDPYAFEFAVRDILLACGFQTLQQVGGSGDLGADLIGVDPWGARVIVQCKRFNPDHRVGSPELQRFLGAMQIHQAQRGAVVTTSSFSQQAIDVARKHNVDLIDGPTLAAMAAGGTLTGAS